MEIEVRLDDLAFVEADAIVWAVTDQMRPTTTAARRLEAAGGETLARHLRTHEPLAVGSAVVTAAGGLPAELLISAVVSSPTEPATKTIVRRATASALHRAEAWRIARVTCGPLGVGAGGLAPETSADVMLEVLREHGARAAFPERVTIVVESEIEHDAFAAALARGAQ